ncbi:sigma factor-like helix-turn-helix DNA-binding protein [Thermaerobacillus caldiproteolyticus]|uniref:sigma factor-like helix-turn-helix DNA-binding protein n=1 Tax=Thermaerobacillus caldiproteolyticus TaxID=247480 RepID=UPI00188D7DB9|nr:sigma factor-like helix-turn-helix DNA-binding protein [Anoxybacillus caldiproteolyticus]QPA30057.1 hypothetical protein ISX45_10340 [Anoxybacillus caldiproteolyticus]
MQKKQIIHTNSVFLFDLIEDDFIILDTIINKDAMLPEDILIRKEEKTEIQNVVKRNLSILERNVFNLYIKGYSPKDIEKELEVSYKSVDNALVRIRKKMKSKKESEILRH